jgi:dihydrodipicolinate synthase/N-acetylneuraminate lyase
MNQRDWHGVFPAMTTPFKEDLSIDYDAVERQAFWLISSGCAGLVALGSLGESPTLSGEEKVEILKTCRRALGERVPLIAGISGLGTPEAVALAKAAEEVGCDGLMVLPPYVYRGDWRETEAHLSAVISATPLSSMLYNNPIAYGTDVTPEQLKQLVRHPNLHAVKESSGDIRRVTAVREVLGDRLAIFVGMDDVVVESVAAGAVGWIAGLVNALPAETVRLFELAKTGEATELRELYEWFLPLLRLDTVPKFVQLIKLVQAEVGKGSARVRPPRLELTGVELEQARHLIQERLERHSVQAV